MIYIYDTPEERKEKESRLVFRNMGILISFAIILVLLIMIIK